MAVIKISYLCSGEQDDGDYDDLICTGTQEKIMIAIMTISYLCIQEKKMMAMRNVVLYIVLAKHDNEQRDLIHRIIKEKILQDLPRSLHFKISGRTNLCLLTVLIRIGSGFNGLFWSVDPDPARSKNVP